MTAATLTMAGHLAHAGAARLVSAPGATLVATTGGYGSHQQDSSWTKGAIAKPMTTFVAFDRKNRPTRPLSELSP